MPDTMGSKWGIFDARRLLKLYVGLGIGGDQLRARAERREVAGARLLHSKPSSCYSTGNESERASDGRDHRKWRETAYRDVGYLAERLVREVRKLLVVGRREVDGDEFVGDVALFGYHRHAARAGGHRETVELECGHVGERRDMTLDVELCAALRLPMPQYAPS